MIGWRISCFLIHTRWETNIQNLSHHFWVSKKTLWAEITNYCFSEFQKPYHIPNPGGERGTLTSIISEHNQRNNNYLFLFLRLEKVRKYKQQNKNMRKDKRVAEKMGRTLGISKKIHSPFNLGFMRRLYSMLQLQYLIDILLLGVSSSFIVLWLTIWNVANSYAFLSY